MATTVEIDCESCGAQLSVAADRKTTECPFCASPTVVERPATAERPAPDFGLGFVVEEDRAKQRLRSWLQRAGLFRPSGLGSAVVDRVRGVYLPSYLFGAIAHTSYSAEIGENYTETYTTTDSKGRTVTRTRTRTEWRSLGGDHSCYILDVIVTASKGIPNAELEAIEPFDLRALRRYRPALIAGWIAEEPSLSPERCAELAKEETERDIGAMLARFMPGDSHRSLRFRTSLRDEVLDHVLLPVWVFAVRYAADKAPLRILVNGQTGKVAGKLPLSVPKILLAVLVVLVVAVAVVLLIVSANK